MKKKLSYDDVIEDFPTLLFIWAGPLAYELIQSNCKGGMPSLPTVRHYLHKKRVTIREGEFRFDGLQRPIDLYDVNVRAVVISEDATRVIAKVNYDRKHNTLVGLVCPCDENGIPIMDTYRFTGFESVKAILKTAEKAKFVYALMAQ